MTAFFELLRRFGKHSTSYLASYPGYRYFDWKRGEGVQPFVETRGAWVGAGEAWASAEDAPLVLEAFAEEAARAGKAVIAFPLSRELAMACEARGFGSAMIGTEVYFDLQDTTPRPELISTAKRLAARRAEVAEFRPEALSTADRTQLDAIWAEWMGTRPTEALDFLNRVEPWTRSEEKKYFRVTLHGETLAFLAAVPIYGRQGWYFVDILRRTQAPAGTTELLILEAARLVRAQGAREVSLGVSPLADLDPEAFRGKRFGFAFLKAFYGHGKFFYNFGSLFAFKMKFRPTRLEPVYIVYKPPRFTLLTVRHILDAFYPGGLLPAIARSFQRAWGRLDWNEIIDPHLRAGIVTRSKPAGSLDWFYRCKLTLSVLPIQIFLFLDNLNSHQRLRNRVAREWAFSGRAFTRDAFKAVLISPFLHWNWTHFAMNTVLTIVFCGMLEYLGGTLLLALCYFVPLFLTNPLMYWLLIFPLKWISPHMWLMTYVEPDVGSSLGIYGAIGGLFHFLRRGSMLLWIFGLAAVAYVFLSHSLIPLNHLLAMSLGWAIGGLLLSVD